jgi:dTDP-4-dehydrorhamnose 3,5-epimerase-like enzyme
MAQVADGAPMSVAGLKTRNCRWIDVRGAVDQRGRINFLEAGKDLPFQPQRLFWLHHIAPGQWRGRHGHRDSQLVFVAMSGGCRVHLDDARVQESVTLDDPARALYVGTWVWHELTDFADDAAILVIASTLYEDAEYLRDYDAFKREAASRS